MLFALATERFLLTSFPAEKTLIQKKDVTVNFHDLSSDFLSIFAGLSRYFWTKNV